ncbi:hypothetical protein BDK51DRAFT_42513 [Blyttiomyces helicus]|uniref:Uncharacterized protein n=1 Tax=Blyttiomyces helicus TaxID=388810 RepID=A0A4P9WK34_9FUNG|nr:hypothetical protein BDK51DRAFT_42513 [Blyttiomyces helicus]|eukprot:RKO92333.1 hypothetical protein BDK51DRAFT_42513 [Blyttiomyces helicus]
MHAQDSLTFSIPYMRRKNASAPLAKLTFSLAGRPVEVARPDDARSAHGRRGTALVAILMEKAHSLHLARSAHMVHSFRGAPFGPIRKQEEGNCPGALGTYVGPLEMISGEDRRGTEVHDTVCSIAPTTHGIVHCGRRAALGPVFVEKSYNLCPLAAAASIAECENRGAISWRNSMVDRQPLSAAISPVKEGDGAPIAMMHATATSTAREVEQPADTRKRTASQRLLAIARPTWGVGYDRPIIAVSLVVAVRLSFAARLALAGLDGVVRLRVVFIAGPFPFHAIRVELLMPVQIGAIVKRLILLSASPRQAGRLPRGAVVDEKGKSVNVEAADSKSDSRGFGMDRATRPAGAKLAPVYR